MTSSGEAIGAVCVIDVKPRGITEQQLSELRFLARQVILAIEQRKRRRDGEKSTARID
jgi:GAF domain-containing protein